MFTKWVVSMVTDGKVAVIMINDQIGHFLRL
jgi:hypothetical protein